ncbi:hypothetical protein RB195_019165 [Necator americanus]|uniref:Uncharacterized protein n=1 Tax=Necator americanus TaxID=51031 RepID=A0ABR1CCW6_NECAM
MCVVLERIVLRRLIKHRKEITHDEKAGFRGRSTIDQIFIEKKSNRNLVAVIGAGAIARPFLFNFAVDDIMRRTVKQCPVDMGLVVMWFLVQTRG